jgi:hypothetical protein
LSFLFLSPSSFLLLSCFFIASLSSLFLSRYRTRLAHGGARNPSSSTVPSYYDDFQLSLPSSSSNSSSSNSSNHLHHHRSYFFEYPVGCCDSSHILPGNMKENSYWINHLKPGDTIAVRWNQKEWKVAVILTVMKDYDLVRMVKVSVSLFPSCFHFHCLSSFSLFTSFSSFILSLGTCD